MAHLVYLGKRPIGDGAPCFIIAEAGSNHNGSLEQARKLIQVAARAGADAVKFQLFRADKVYTKSAGESDYLKIPRSIYDIVAEMEMPFEWVPRLAQFCQENEILFFASVSDEGCAQQLDPYVPAYKIASYEMTHHPLVRAVAKKGKPVIISTGTSNLEEVTEMAQTFYATGNENLILMQCTAAYPAPVESLNIRAIDTMKKAFGVPVGLSDHSRDPWVGPMTAVAAGANLIEKHFTLSNELPGPDHAFAVEPDELRLMVQKIREVEKALGTGDKAMHPVETELKGFARRTIFAIRDISPGEEIGPEDVDVLRCGKLPFGLLPKELPHLLGRKAARPIPAGSAIQGADIA